MTCQHCVNSVTEELMKISGVNQVEISLDTGAVSIDSAHEINRVDIEHAISEAGYTAEVQ